MAEYIDRDLIEWYGCNFEDAGCENRECSGCSHAECSHSQVMQISTADVIEHSKIDKAIEEITKLRDSCNRMITEEATLVNECYKQFANCYDECLKIIKQNIGE